MPDISRTSIPSCPPSMLELVERFGLHRDTYRQPTYNETQVRREFVDPLFKALGWDIDNEQGHAEVYKDVVHKDAVADRPRRRITACRGEGVLLRSGRNS